MPRGSRTAQEQILRDFLVGDNHSARNYGRSIILLRDCCGDATDAFELARDHCNYLSGNPRGRGTEFGCDFCLEGYEDLNELCYRCLDKIQRWQRIAMGLRYLVIHGNGTTELAEGPHQARSGWRRSQTGQEHIQWILELQFSSWVYWLEDDRA